MLETEKLGPAERIIQTLLGHPDHMYHGRPGLVTKDGRTNAGARWVPAVTKKEDTVTHVFTLSFEGKKSKRTLAGQLDATYNVVNQNRAVGEFRKPGLFPEAAAWFYHQIAEIWKLDNEFAARWASYAYDQDHQDLKVALAAFMLVQSRRGDPVIDKKTNKVEFFDTDFRDVGEAMCLIERQGKSFNPKMLLRIRELLSLPEIAKINHDLGFGRSVRRPFLGRWSKAVERYLMFREDNPQLLKGLVKKGFRTSVMRLARHIGYKPQSSQFFQILRWPQVQSKDGRRSLAIGKAVSKAETWEELTEAQICQRIEKTKPDWKRIVGLLPKDIGVTRAIMAAAIENKCLSDKDLIIATPTLEELGLLNDQEIKTRWEKATQKAEDQRALNIARRVKTTEVKEVLQKAADTAVQVKLEEATRNLRLYVIVDKSGSMESSLKMAKTYLAKFIQGIPLDRLHVAVFDTQGREVTIPKASANGVEMAFKGITAGGGTSHGKGISCLTKYRPKEDEDVLMIFVGDEGEHGTFTADVRKSGLNPVAFGLLRVGDLPSNQIVRATARELGIPCFPIEEKIFDDPYAVTRTLSNLIKATPVAKAEIRIKETPRMTLVDQIVKCPILQKPAWSL